MTFVLEVFMNIIIVGCGKVGYTLVEQLGGENHNITVIDTNEEKVNSITDDLDAMGIVGNGVSFQTLSEAGIDHADLLIAADCTAYAYANIHEEFMRGHVTIIGCPKLDAVDYSEKLTEIIRSNDIKSVTVLRMEVPCCGGLEHAAITALKNSGKFIPWNVVTFSTDGRILDR